jgi:hypothetical protein
MAFAQQPYLFGRILGCIMGLRTKHEINDLIAKILGVQNSGRLFDFLEFVAEHVVVEILTGILIAKFLVLNPEAGEGHVEVENVMSGCRTDVESSIQLTIPSPKLNAHVTL